MRFQVSLPSPANVIAGLIEPSFQSFVEPHYEAALSRAIQNIQADISHQDLAVQFDIATDMLILHGVWPQAYIPTEPELLPHVSERIARVVECVAADVEVGFHFCYRGAKQKNFLDPPDMSMMVDLALNLMGRVRRKVAWLHMPVPRTREDIAYFEPLRRLVPKMLQKGTELYLGLVHSGDLEGTERKMRLARKVLGDQIMFGVASECGLGTERKADFEDILSIAYAASIKEI